MEIQKMSQICNMMNNNGKTIKVLPYPTSRYVRIPNLSSKTDKRELLNNLWRLLGGLTPGVQRPPRQKPVDIHIGEPLDFSQDALRCADRLA